MKFDSIKWEVQERFRITPIAKPKKKYNLDVIDNEIYGGCPDEDDYELS